LHVSERHACAALGQHRSTQPKVPCGREGEERLTSDIFELAQRYGRYGYREVAGVLRHAGWILDDKRVSTRLVESVIAGSAWMNLLLPAIKTAAMPRARGLLVGGGSCFGYCRNPASREQWPTSH
jgi:hypothetical protein